MLKFRIKTDAQGNKFLETPANGKALLSIAQLNKGTAFTMEERHEFDVLGKLPARIETLAEQTERAYQQYSNFAKRTNRNIYLNQLLNHNQILFYNLVKQHTEEMLPNIYTPIVGDFVRDFHKRFITPRGLYISFEDQDYIDEILENRTNEEIDLIVVTDGEGVLGIGDQGIGAMAIPLAKLMVYTIFGGVDPNKTLPIMLDVGTNNQKLLEDPLYLGWIHSRIEGEEYYQFIDKLIKSIKKKFPHVFLHWEDFGRANAYRNYMTYRNEICSFNDDMQGTGVVALAAILSAIQITYSLLPDQRIVVFGGGTAGMGVTESIYRALLQMGLTPEEAAQRFWIVDREGLLTENIKEITHAQKPFVRKAADIQHWQIKDKNKIELYEVVKHVKPTILIGCSAKQGAFQQHIVTEMAHHVKHPIILPLSNPNEYVEAVPQDLIEWTDGQALIATGSPFDPVQYKGKTYFISQCNNYHAFPGIGLGVISIGAKHLSDSMLSAASQALATFSYEHSAGLLPSIAQACEASKQIAYAVAETAIKEGRNGIPIDKPIHELIAQNYWEPEYLPYKKSP